MYGKKIQELGLVPDYKKKQNTSKFLRQLMCLPFLPAEQIMITFRDFYDILTPHHPDKLHKLIEYIESTWMNGAIWRPEDWSIFGMAVRTNNDVEGWHNLLNKLCRKVGHDNINMYELIEVLHKEAKFVSIQCKLVTDEKLKRYQRLKYQKYQKNIFDLWDSFTEKKITPIQLLRELSKHHFPVNT